MASGETEIRIKTTSDNSGAKSAEKALDSVRATANRVSGGVVSSFTKVVGVLNATKSAVNKVMSAFGLIGLAMQGVQAVIDGYRKIKDWLDRDKKAAEELNKAIQDAKNAEAVDQAASSYAKLNKQISEALRLEQERDRLAAQKQSANRSAEDQFADLEMQRELGTISADDPDRAQKETLIRNKYARAKSARDLKRAQQDLASRRGRLMDESADADNRADAFEREIEKSGDAVGAIKRQIAAEKDPERKKALEAQLDKLVGENQKKKSQAEELRRTAKSKQTEAANLEGADRADVYRNKADNLRLDASDRDARNQMTANAAERKRRSDEEAKKKEAERIKSETAAAQLESDKSEKSTAEADLDAALQRLEEIKRGRLSNAEKLSDAENARNRSAGGNRRQRAASAEQYSAEKRSIENANFELDRSEAALMEMISTLQARIRKLASCIENQEKRLRNQRDADGSEGD